MTDLDTSKVCTAGHVCSGGANTATPTNLASDGGYECPAGHYCEAGTTIETPCPLLSYRATTGGIVELDDTTGCTLCTGGS